MVIISGVFAGQAYAAAEVTNLYFSKNQEVITLQMDISRVTTHKVFALKNPHRLVIDVSDAQWHASSKILGSYDLVKDIRHGVQDGHDLRIVLETTEAVDVLQDDRSGSQLTVQFIAADAKRASKVAKQLPQSMTKAYKSSVPFSLPTFESLKVTEYKPRSSPDSFPPRKPAASTPVSYYKPIIVLDAGHGGVDPGAIGKSGIQEKKITLQYTLALKRILEKSGRYRVMLTRSRDHYVNLADRVERARKADGDLFISIHADSHKNSNTRGLSVYTISENRAKREANKLVKQSHKKEVIRGVDLKRESSDVKGVLIDMVQRDTNNTAASFAELLVKELGDDAKLLDKPHRNASLAVLTGVDIPSVLIELGYLSNRYEEKLLRTLEYRNRLTSEIAQAIDTYFRYHPPAR